SRFAQRLPARPPHKIHPEDRPIELGEATAIVLGMGRVGLATYRQLTDAHHYTVLGVEHDPLRVRQLRERGVNVVEGDATDYDFWTRLVRSDTVRIVVLAMPAQHANIDALSELRSFGYGQVTVAAVASYQEDVEELEELGLDAVIRLYEGAGETLADRSVAAARQLP
ncbi:MAG TPA: NAD(P)-binding protein, partial [Microbacteriaceae bacterium]|nr:NAD(P)-binding protein [Microbacteriaceae bacterium]